MSEKMISDLDKRLSMQEVTVNRVLEGVEKQTNSTNKLAECVAAQTAKFEYLAKEVEDLKGDIKESQAVALDNKTEIAVIKRGNKWQEWAERGVVAAIIGAIIWAMKQG